MSRKEKKIANLKIIDRDVRTVGKLGDFSLYVTIPKSFADKLRIEKGSILDMYLTEDDKIVVEIRK